MPIPVESFLNGAQQGPQLRRTLGWFQLTCMGVGSTVGGGVFVLTGEVAARYAGPAVVLSFLFASLVCLFAGLCYAEFAAMIPRSGSAYTYVSTTWGEAVGWLVGWTLILEYLFGCELIAIGWSGYLDSTLASL
ncbi:MULTISPECIES: amino acid permease [Bradyrhizobium]|uniref:Amino acid permease n=1 Tax=Bradyrhizobium rifense TaxID=515499 RepID=A0A5D3K9P8_9BRAD|nr:amino acid permease [Bradyrhizobium rifense]TYL92604.1 amino acid permease [Bradyrhizobium rifense]